MLNLKNQNQSRTRWNGDNSLIATIRSTVGAAEIIKSTKKEQYLNLPIAFDIETSTFPHGANGDLRAAMYIWQACVGDVVVHGRTWAEYVDFTETLRECVDEDVKIVIYVHNLAYEFQWIRKWFDWDDIFAIDSRKVLRATTSNGIEYRCSYLLSGKSLAAVGSSLTKYKVEKKVGDLDYDKVRNSNTELTEEEWGYCESDVQVVCAYIQEQIDSNNGKITDIPMTKTGYVRRYCKTKCYGWDYRKYTNLMRGMTISGVEEYKQLKRAFAGGFTHANRYNCNKVHHDVTSLDFTSSYPAVIIAEQYPMGRGHVIPNPTQEQIDYYLKVSCCVFDITFRNIHASTTYDCPISESKCTDIKGKEIDNGRVISADELTTTITNVDFDVFKLFYTWSSCTITNFRHYYKAYLPKPFIQCVIDFYRDKTTLKDVDGSESEYQLKKEMLNSTYGMMVTDPCRDIIDTDTWETKPLAGEDLEDAIKRYNESKNRFTFYPWGVFVTAYARRNVLMGVYNAGDDYIYTDTDSVKMTNYEEHKEWFDNYDKEITNKIEKTLKYYDLPLDSCRPKTVKGVEKPLGVWDNDGRYDDFKTLGAKRYMYRNSKGIKITVAGLAKKKAGEYIAKQKDPFAFFTDGMKIPEDYSGRLIHGYIDEETKGEVTDYNGNTCTYYERGSITLSKSDYTLTMGKEYLNLLSNLDDFDEYSYNLYEKKVGVL